MSDSPLPEPRTALARDDASLTEPGQEFLAQRELFTEQGAAFWALREVAARRASSGKSGRIAEEEERPVTLISREWPSYDHEFEVVNYDELVDEDERTSPKKAVDLEEGAHTLTHP